MPRRNDRAKRMDPREYEFLRGLNCSEDEPCNQIRKDEKGKKHKGKGKANDNKS